MTVRVTLHVVELANLLRRWNECCALKLFQFTYYFWQVNILPFLCFLCFVLCSSLESRDHSAIPFRKTPIESQFEWMNKWIYVYYILVDPKQSVFFVFDSHSFLNFLFLFIFSGFILSLFIVWTTLRLRRSISVELHKFHWFLSLLFDFRCLWFLISHIGVYQSLFVT